MKKNASPIAISVAAVVLIGLMVVMYRFFFPPSPPNDMANPNHMPAYAREFMKNRKAKAAGAEAGSAATAPQPNGAPPGH